MSHPDPDDPPDLRGYRATYPQIPRTVLAPRTHS
jgi:hypothetical protein